MSDKSKWVWGAVGLAAGAGLVYWLHKKNVLSAPLSQEALPVPPVAQPSDAGTEGMVNGYTYGQATKGVVPVPMAPSAFDDSVAQPPDFEESAEADNGEF